MKNKSFLIGLGLVACTVLTSFSIISPSFSQSTASKTQSNQTTFVCTTKFDQSSSQRIPVTAAWIPERKNHVYFVGWKSEYFLQSGWTAEKRCEHVTQKFQELYTQNRLNYISSGRNNGYPVICGVSNLGETCNANNQLFTLRSDTNPDQVIQILMDIAEGKATEGILLQTSNNQRYIPVKAFLLQSPIIEIEQSANTQK
ncbi:COP23 domain-containing protein [Nodularia spumigena]|uniref:COP23 domain-containing protein n=1 Tax=Nodularia spumigena TaxID=70799 RepID=UPI00232B76BD|nr:COP23 domain-containing protein [Nodularia spumigena]MDB9306619.1 COP23 domain-containing protein [Nodularia spumigena CS-591/12]MDB9319665.1 COP23 domain-containing protein [Nodularia spumigena CS-590/01A]MDB9324411.1 COP23 domain-containing protein [Nodularia spumigena CS-591/07A]MDB9325241.1 COP23 domain-containing protein [Nodularia spumigena CS-590/02]MDB9332129.1 COP23 domain-containing protein [Nodularia spumigena CS-591/04]